MRRLFRDWWRGYTDADLTKVSSMEFAQLAGAVTVVTSGELRALMHATTIKTDGGIIAEKGAMREKLGGAVDMAEPQNPNTWETKT